MKKIFKKLIVVPMVLSMITTSVMNVSAVDYRNYLSFPNGDINEDFRVDNKDLVKMSQFLINDLVNTQTLTFTGEMYGTDLEINIFYASQDALRFYQSFYEDVIRENPDEDIRKEWLEYSQPPLYSSRSDPKNNITVEFTPDLNWWIVYYSFSLVRTSDKLYKEQMIRADINKDGVVDIADLALIKQHVMGDTVNNLK